MHFYRICGLSVASDIVLPGLIAGKADSFPEVTIRRGAVPQALSDAGITGPTWQIAGKQFLLSVPNVARFLLNDGDQIVFAPESEASAEDVPIFILGTVFGILLHQREQIVLHASGVEVNGKAVVFCGASGAGKSLAVCLSFTVLAGYLRTKLATNGLINSLALFGILVAWFYFPSAVIAPVTIGWGWLASSLLAIAFIEASAAMTLVACALALFSRETTLIFGLTMFVALLLFEHDRRRGVVVSVIVLAASCLLYLVLRIGFTAGYAHQIDPAGIVGRVASLSFPAHFFVQLILAQGILILLLVLIAMKRARYAVYLAAAAGGMAIVAIATGVTDVGLLVGETLPFYALIFFLAWNGALPTRPADKPTIGTASSLRN